MTIQRLPVQRVAGRSSGVRGAMDEDPSVLDLGGREVRPLERGRGDPGAGRTAASGGSAWTACGGPRATCVGRSRSCGSIWNGRSNQSAVGRLASCSSPSSACWQSSCCRLRGRRGLRVRAHPAVAGGSSRSGVPEGRCTALPRSSSRIRRPDVRGGGMGRSRTSSAGEAPPRGAPPLEMPMAPTTRAPGAHTCRAPALPWSPPMSEGAFWQTGWRRCKTKTGPNLG
jgi:hypothetical protein